jgi:hypothetical protein
MTQVPDFASKPTLTGERVILRPFVDGDTPALLAALGDPDVRILTGSVHDEAAARTPAARTRRSWPPKGVLRESLRFGDQWIDATVMSILASEWPPAPSAR